MKILAKGTAYLIILRANTKVAPMKIWLLNLLGVIFVGSCVTLTLGQTLGMANVGTANLNIGSLTSTATYTISGTTYYLFGGESTIHRSSNPTSGFTQFIKLSQSGNQINSMSVVQISSTQAKLVVVTSGLRFFTYTLTASSATQVGSGGTWSMGSYSYNYPLIPVGAYDSSRDYLWIASGPVIVWCSAVSGNPSCYVVQPKQNTYDTNNYRLFSVVYDPQNDKLIFTCGDGWLISVKGNADANSASYRKLGAWNQNYAVYNPVKRNTILISDSGIVSEVSFTSVGSTVLSLTGLYLEPETVFTGAVFDSAKQVLFVSGTFNANSAVFRVQLSTWSSIASFTVGS